MSATGIAETFLLSVTDETSSPTVLHREATFDIRMPVIAFGSSEVFGCDSLTTEKVLSMGHRTDMERVHTRRSFTCEVIEFKTNGNWSMDKCPSMTMREDITSLAIDTEYAIPVVVLSCHPEPASTQFGLKYGDRSVLVDLIPEAIAHGLSVPTTDIRSITWQD